MRGGRGQNKFPPEPRLWDPLAMQAVAKLWGVDLKISLLAASRVL